MIRAGHNVLSVHADAHFSDDPYIYLKRAPLNKATLVTMSHGGWTGLTTGFLYVQNAAVAGPVSWIFTEAVDRVGGRPSPSPAQPLCVCIAAACLLLCMVLHGLTGYMSSCRPGMAHMYNWMAGALILKAA